MGLVHKEGILGGCDCQATSSDGNIASSNFKKIIRLDSHSLLAISGVAGLGIEMARLLRTNLCYEADLREGEYVPPKTKANMVADRLRSMFPSAISLNLIVAPILITYDMDKREPGGRVFSIWPDGAIEPEKGFATGGSGNVPAKITIELMLGRLGKEPAELTLNEACTIVVAALRMANRHDSHTGKSIYLQNIDKVGIETIDDDNEAVVEARRMLQREEWFRNV